MPIVPILALAAIALITSGCVSEMSTKFKDIEFKVGDNKKEEAPDQDRDQDQAPPKSETTATIQPAIEA